MDNEQVQADVCDIMLLAVKTFKGILSLILPLPETYLHPNFKLQTGDKGRGLIKWLLLYTET